MTSTTPKWKLRSPNPPAHKAQGRSVAAVMREALAVYLNKEVPASELEKKYLALEERLASLESRMREQ